MTAKSAIGRWVRGSIWILTLLIPLACNTGDQVAGPSSEPNPFAEFDRIAPPQPAAGISVPAGARISFSENAASAKIVGTPKTKSRLISADEGGRISLTNYPTWARITVFEASIAEDTVIDMTLSGSSVSTSLVFGPDGLAFSPSAVVDVITPIEGMNRDNLKAYLTSADGSIVEAPVKVYVLGPLALIRTWVAHFTDVDFDDGYADEENPES